MAWFIYWGKGESHENVCERRSIEKIVEEQIQKWNVTRRKKGIGESVYPTVTISREPGSGGRIIAESRADASNVCSIKNGESPNSSHRRVNNRPHHPTFFIHTVDPNLDQPILLIVYGRQEKLSLFQILTRAVKDFC